jgi:hypothetical protein
VDSGLVSANVWHIQGFPEDLLIAWHCAGGCERHEMENFCSVTLWLIMDSRYKLVRHLETRQRMYLNSKIWKCKWFRVYIGSAINQVRADVATSSNWYLPESCPQLMLKKKASFKKTF